MLAQMEVLTPKKSSREREALARERSFSGKLPRKNTSSATERGGRPQFLAIFICTRWGCELASRCCVRLGVVGPGRVNQFADAAYRADAARAGRDTVCAFAATSALPAILSGSLKQAGLVALVAAQILTTAAGAFAQSRDHAPSIFTDESKRPANFYTLLAELDPAVCQPVLRSVSGEFAIGEDKLDGNPRLSVTGDLLLQSDLQVSWSRQLIHAQDMINHGADSLDHGRADLAGNGRPAGVYRFAFERSVGSPTPETLVVNSFILSDAPPPDFSSQRPRSSDVSARIAGQAVMFGVRSLSDIRNRPNLARAATSEAQPVLFNLVTVARKAFVLAVDARQAEFELSKPRGFVDLYVLRFESPTDIRPVCHFRGGY